MERNEEKKKMEDRCFEYMQDQPQYCGDNTHKLACVMLKSEFGVTVSEEMISFLRSVDRSRQKVLKNNPEMDLRVKSKALEQNDREYYRRTDAE